MAYRLSWQRLLSDRRPDLSGDAAVRRGTPSESRTAFERDYDRIVFSAPFRRLARKTQVHPLATNDHIHNRLTHSMEVASIGRGFARNVAEIARERSDLGPEDEIKLVWILQSACLIHDVGNPPFGHAGEEVIRAWAGEHAQQLFTPERVSDVHLLEAAKQDWLHFEGNAQGFRLASRSDNPDAGYLHLTHATLGATIKYPWTSGDPRADELRKHNVYSTEEDLFLQMADDLGLRLDGRVCRHPLSFLTEAADDICYRVIDLEDAVEMGIQDHESVFALFRSMAGDAGNEEMKLPQLRGHAIGNLMKKFTQAFADNYDAIMNGEREADLKSSLDGETLEQLEQIKFRYEAIFGHSKKVAMELGAYQILGRILETMMKSIQSIYDAPRYGDVAFIAKRCAELAWGRDYAQEHIDRDYLWWLSRMNDFISGMTDDYATKLSGDIGGHSYLNR